MRRIYGFTLIELVVVLFLVVIVAAFVITKTPSTSVYNFSSVTEQLRRDIRYTQTLAMSLNATYSINITNNGYSITPAPPSGAYTVSMPAGVTLSPVTITFTSMGAPTAAASVTITASGVTPKTLTISAETGFING